MTVVDLQVPDKAKRPTHVAIIMDGNGRWAIERGLPRLEGHRKGASVVREITTFARELGIRYLTLYSFSRQNWRRPTDEVAGLMVLLEDYCHQERAILMKHDIRLAVIGGTERLPQSTRQALEALVEETADNRAMTLCLAVDYGGREELVVAMKRLAADVRAKRISVDAIDETAIETRLHTALIPDPDLLIRTSGELRISNFLLWQLAYAELHFCAARWPDFSRNHFVAALQDYAARERRFGATDEQLAIADEPEFHLGELPQTAADLEEDDGPC